MLKEDKVVVYLATRNYYKYLPAAFTSLILNSSVDKVYLLIEDDTFPYSLPKQVIIVNISKQDYFNINCPNYNSKWTYMVLMKIALPFIMPLRDKILYLDVDTIVDQNIDNIWDIPLDGYCFGMVKEIHKSTESRNYYNAGVMLMNLKKLRSDGIAQRLIDELKKRRFSFCEQDCINELCQDTILEIPSCYNVNLFSEVPNEEKIIHFAAIRNWENRILYQKYFEKYNEVFG